MGDTVICWAHDNRYREPATAAQLLWQLYGQNSPATVEPDYMTKYQLPQNICRTVL